MTEHITDGTYSVRDSRRTRWWWVDNAIMERYAAQLGPHALAVYCYLCYRAGRKTICWPSQATIAEDLGMGLRSVGRAVVQLQAAGLITITTRVNQDGFRVSNIYILQDMAVVRPVEADQDTSEGPSGSATQAEPSSHTDRTVQPQGPSRSACVADKQDSSELDSSEIDSGELDSQQQHAPVVVGQTSDREEEIEASQSDTLSSGGGVSEVEEAEYWFGVFRDLGVGVDHVTKELITIAMRMDEHERGAEVDDILDYAKATRIGPGWVIERIRELGKGSPNSKRGFRWMAVLRANRGRDTRRMTAY